MTQSLALSSSTQNSEKLNQAGFDFPPGVIIPVYLQFNGSKSKYQVKFYYLKAEFTVNGEHSWLFQNTGS